METKVCHCALPALTGSTECCKNCNNNPDYNIGFDDSATSFKKLTEAKPRHVCPKCMEVFMADEANYCPKCGHKIVEISNKNTFI